MLLRHSDLVEACEHAPLLLMGFRLARVRIPGILKMLLQVPFPLRAETTVATVMNIPLRRWIGPKLCVNENTAIVWFLFGTVMEGNLPCAQFDGAFLPHRPLFI